MNIKEYIKKLRESIKIVRGGNMKVLKYECFNCKWTYLYPDNREYDGRRCEKCGGELLPAGLVTRYKLNNQLPKPPRPIPMPEVKPCKDKELMELMAITDILDLVIKHEYIDTAIIVTSGLLEKLKEYKSKKIEKK